MKHSPPIANISHTIAFLLIAIASVTPAQAQDGDSPFVRRDRIQLNLTGAELIIATSRAKANELGIKENIAVVDAGGHLLAFARMDGARPASVYTAITKATSAATKLGDTGPLPNSKAANTHLSLAVENAAALSGGKFTTLKGGVAIVVADQVIGAVGVGGASGEQDEQVARAGVEALLLALKMTSTSPEKTEPKNVSEKLYQNWLVEDIEGGGVIDRAQTTIQINEDGTANGSTGLNRYMTTPTIGEGKISFGEFPITRRAGPPAVMDQESRFLSAMQKVKQYSIDDNQILRLLDAEGKEIMRLTAIE